MDARAVSKCKEELDGLLIGNGLKSYGDKAEKWDEEHISHDRMAERT